MASFTDTFTRADGPLGAGWLQDGTVGTSAAGLAVIGNAAEYGDNTGGSGAMGRARFESDVSSPDHKVTVTLPARTGSYCDARVLARYAAGAFTAYEVRWSNDSSANLVLSRVNAGSATDLTSVTQPFTAGDTLELEVSGTGGTVSLVVRTAGVQRISTTDTSGSRIVAGTRGGVGCFGAAGVVQVRFDDFTVADLSAALDAPTGLTVDAVRSTEADVSWDAVSGATGYKVTVVGP